MQRDMDELQREKEEMSWMDKARDLIVLPPFHLLAFHAFTYACYLLFTSLQLQLQGTNARNSYTI